MNLFNDEIKEVYELLNSLEKKELPITDQLLEDVGPNNMIFRDECAYELGDKKSLSFDLSSSSIDVEDKIYLVGKDLSEIQGSEDFMRITLLQIKDEGSNADSSADSNADSSADSSKGSNGGGLTGDALYNRLEQIKLTKYRVSPKGYMLRTSTGNREKVRVSKDVARKSSFSQIGSAYMQAYKKLDYVEHVTILFVVGHAGDSVGSAGSNAGESVGNGVGTGAGNSAGNGVGTDAGVNAGNSSLYDRLSKIASKKAEITDTIDHILKGFMINDCDSCSAKELCDEVEGLREIHQSVN